MLRAGGLALALLSASCSCDAACGPDTCTGCCDTSGLCVGGATDSFCGANGAACRTCGTGFSCLSQACSASGAAGGGAAGGQAAGGGSGGGTGGGGADDLDGGQCDALEQAASDVRDALRNCPGTGDLADYAFNRIACDNAFACSNGDWNALQGAAACEKGIAPCAMATDRTLVTTAISNCQSLASEVSVVCTKEILGM
jgi:hypothetical protein